MMFDNGTFKSLEKDADRFLALYKKTLADAKAKIATLPDEKKKAFTVIVSDIEVYAKKRDTKGLHDCMNRLKSFL